jgi:RNA polymerase sigma factor (sigma-70 family)
MGGDPLPAVLRHLLAQVAPPEGAADAVLLQRFVAQGDEASFEALVRRHGLLVLDVCLGVLHNRHDAEDCFQATFLVLARKADSIRQQDALGSFLYGVAQRIALNVRRREAQRRERERQAAEMRSPEPNDELDRRELRALLCQELEHVAEEYRSALRLFYLEGKSYSETARLLHCPVGTVRSRLARGREALRRRLVGRDLARASASVVGVPAGLLAATMQAAVKGGASPLVQALAEEALRGLALSKVKSVLAVLLAVGVLAVTTGLLAGRDGRRTEPRPPVAEEALTGIPGRLVQDADLAPPRLDVAGRALDARGQPVVGATVYLREWTPWRAVNVNDVLAVTGTDHRGAFAFRGVMGRPPTSAWEAEQHPWQVVVVAPGRAVAWQHLTPEVRRGGVEFRVGPGSRLTGRLTGPAGQPVSGALVRVLELMPLGRRTTSTGPSSWGNARWHKDALGLQGSGVPLTARSDAQGRFVLDMLPEGMLVRLGLSSDDYLAQAVSTATTTGPQPNLIHEHVSKGKKWLFVEPVLTGDWTVQLRPARRLHGRVLEAGSDRPIPGARVTVFSSMHTADAQGRLIFDEVIQGFRVASDVPATADAQGRFTLPPLPPVSTWVWARGPDTTDYLGLSQALRWPERGEPELTFRLRRGIALTGQVVDQDSGRGIAGVRMSYHSGRDSSPVAPGLVQTDSQGRFRIVVQPGEGKLAADGAEVGYHDRQSHSMKATPARPPGPLTFSLRRGIAIRGRVLGPDGRGLRGAEVKLENQAEPGYPLRACVSGDGGTFHLGGLPSGPAYEWVVIHPALRLGARLPQVIPSDRKEPLPVDIGLRPLGTLTGRALGSRRSALAGAAVRITAVIHRPGRDERQVEVAVLTTDGAGRFRFDRLLPRPQHRFRVEVTAPGHVGLRSAAIEVRSGETRALSDLVLPAVGPALSGTVVGATGRLLADVRLQAHLADPGAGTSLIEPQPVVTGADGRFRLSGLPSGALELVAEQCVPGAHDPGRPAGPTVKFKVEAGRTDLVLHLRAGAG